MLQLELAEDSVCWLYLKWLKSLCGLYIFHCFRWPVGWRQRDGLIFVPVSAAVLRESAVLL